VEQWKTTLLSLLLTSSWLCCGQSSGRMVGKRCGARSGAAMHRGMGIVGEPSWLDNDWSPGLIA
jgi:ABC-type molybdenum transport system ATPase subunit/photorepair protein PhrA